MKTIRELFDLTEKRAIVTGGGSGFGKGIALRLAEAGAGVMIADINLEAAEQVVDEIKAAGGKARAVQSDVGKTSDAQKVTAATLEAFGSVDILVNVAGIRLYSQMSKITEAQWDKILDINLKSIFFFSQAAAEAMKKGGRGGKIVNISSVGAIRPHGFCAHYDASKGGIIALTQALALELAPYNIQVNSIAPGGSMTPGVLEGVQELQAAYKEFEHPVVNCWTLQVPWFRFADPDDIARVVLFLASEASDYMTGTFFPVDGGRSLL